METKYKSLFLFKFQNWLIDKANCYNYLVRLKWDEGYSCKKFENTKFYADLYAHDRQYTKFSYVKSTKVGTLFQQVKLSFLKAFLIVCYVSCSKKEIAGAEMSRKLTLLQKTFWLFKRNGKRVMESSQQFFMTIKTAINESYVGGQVEKAIGRNVRNTKSVFIANKKYKRGFSLMYSRVIASASKGNVAVLVNDHIALDDRVRTGNWVEYLVLDKYFNNLMQKISEKKGNKFATKYCATMTLDAWFRELRFSINHLQTYADDFIYRINKHFSTDGIFENSLIWLVKSEIYPNKKFISK
jgi:hypothetical protein